MTTARKPKPADDAPAAADAFDVDALLAAAEITERDTKKRPTVDVPAKILAFAQDLFDRKKRATFPVADQAQFDREKLMWQSAADQLTPQRSATVTEVRKVKDGPLTGLSVSIGDRRGNNDKKAAASADGDKS